MDKNRLLKEAKAGKISSFAKLLTWGESAPTAEIYGLEGFLNPPQMAFRFGVTGPPGAGKSTLVSALIGRLRALNLKVGVLAVDPSSPFTGGAILGDRIRYQEHFLDEQVFIRSLGTRGSLGGLSASAHRLLRLFDLCGFDVVLVETVGVGQTELDILHVADEVGVVLVPESGDSIQAMKAGLMEVADVFMVNKSDRPGAQAMANDIRSSFFGELDGEEPPQVYLTQGQKGEGLDEVVAHLKEKVDSKDFYSRRSRPERLRHEAQMILRSQFEKGLETQLGALETPEDLKNLIENG
ncbi:MAG: methylmalonyl Co-A mutase-associated GTPase MeaB [Bdellovibrionaceae bacterium]|nr:methylmalonyl Co-A mutase-associated GTPase MeaB [Pseudobdellovibrionaceae bacterium]|tara:strand:+ start:2085 stop:2972 length:888 start_codon:yes stop_codon:yes gene_type:complete